MTDVWVQGEREAGEMKTMGRRAAEMNEGHEPRCSDKLFTGFFNTELPAAFHPAVRCPRRMAGEEKCHSLRGAEEKRGRAAETHGGR